MNRWTEKSAPADAFTDTTFAAGEKKDVNLLLEL
jgi:hypothetical protein